MRWAVAAVLCLPLSSALAQLPEPGARLRLQLGPPTNHRVTGLYQGRQDTVLLVSADAQTRRIPVGEILRLELSRGRKPSVAGGVVGLILGAGAGFALGCLANPDSYGVYCAGQDDTKVIVGTTLGGLLGAFAGATLFKQERWTPLVLR